MSSNNIPIEKNIAFVMGIARYGNDIPTLKTQINDSEPVAKPVQFQGFDVVLETDLTDESLSALLKRLKNDYQTESLHLVVYYPVQGVQHEDIMGFKGDFVPKDALMDWPKLEQQEDRIKALKKERDEAEKQRVAAEQSIKVLENQRRAAILQQNYAEKQRNRSKKRTERAVFYTRVAIIIGLIVLVAGIIAVVKNMEVTKQKKITENKAKEAQLQLRNALISERSKLNDSLQILVQEIELFGKAQELGFVENRFNKFNDTWHSIENLTANIRDSIKLDDKFIDNFKWSVLPDAAYNKREAAQKSSK